jgi:hypothetical protein
MAGNDSTGMNGAVAANFCVVSDRNAPADADVVADPCKPGDNRAGVNRCAKSKCTAARYGT